MHEKMAYKSMLSACLLVLMPFLSFMDYARSEKPDWISTEHKLMHDLMENYSNDVRPVSKPSDKVNVELGIALVNLNDLDERKRILYLNTWLRMAWNDVQLKWDKEKYDNLTEMRISIDKLWQPDIMLYNSFSDYSQAIHNTLAVVYNTGRVLWIPPAFIASYCPIDLTDFPYDTQVCQLKFGSWTYSSKQMTLELMGGKTSLDTSSMKEHHEFDLVKTDVKQNYKYYGCCPDVNYQDITYTLHLKRAAHSINHMIVVPSILFSLFLPIIFILPPEVEEKIHYGVGLLIVNSLHFLVLVDVIPAGHPTVPAIGHYHISNIILTCLALALSALIRNIWTKGQRGSRMPSFVKNYVLGLCGKMMCVSRDEYMPVGGGMQPDHSMRKLEVMTDAEEERADSSNREDDREQILRNFARCAQVAEWKQLAIILDRLGFVVFLTISVIITIAMVTR